MQDKPKTAQQEISERLFAEMHRAGTPDQSGHQSVGFYSEKQVVAITSLSGATIWRMRQAKTFPDPVSISKGRVAYPKSVIHEWIAERMGDDAHAA